MFPDVNKIGKKLKRPTELVEEVSTEIEANKLTEKTEKILETPMEIISDGAKRTTGKLKGQFIPPRTETKKGLLKDETYFICADCGARLGPIETTKWRNILKAIMGGGLVAAGVVTGNPFLLLKGGSSLSGLRKNDKGMIARLKEDSKRREEARQYLLQCEYCGEWVCSACWDAERSICNRCAKKNTLL